MSTIIATTLSNGSVSVPTATVVNGSAKAFLKVDQRSTQAILGSFNVSSITDFGIFRTTMTFSSAMDNANYSPAGGTNYTVAQYSQFQFDDTLTTSCGILNSPDANQSNADGVISCVIHGDLA